MSEFELLTTFKWLGVILAFMFYASCGIGVVRMVLDIRGKVKFDLFEFFCWPLVCVIYACCGKLASWESE